MAIVFMMQSHLCKNRQKKIFQWFCANQMKVNKDKYHLIVGTDKSIKIQIGESPIKRST